MRAQFDKECHEKALIIKEEAYSQAYQDGMMSYKADALLQIESINDKLIELEKKLSPKPNQEIVQGEIINIRDNLNCIEWDSLVVVMASNNRELIEKNSNIEIPYSLDINTYFLNDQDAYIFFLKNNKVFYQTMCLFLFEFFYQYEN